MDELLDLFTPDAVLVAGAEYVGHAGIRTLFGTTTSALAGDTETGRIAHHVSSIRVDLDGPTAVARSYFLAITEHGPDHWGRYRDDLAHDGTRWRFTRRVAITDGRAAGAWAAGLA